MNCKSCGNPLTVEDKFCKKCGTPIAQAAVQPAVAPVAPAPVAPAQPAPAPAPAPAVAPVVQAPVVQAPVAPAPVAPAVQPAPVPAVAPVAVAPAVQPAPAPAVAPVAPAPQAQPAIRPVGPAPAPMPGAYQAPPKKGANPIVMVVLALVAFGIGYFGYKLLSGGSSVVAKETSTVTYQGYTFEVPVDMQAHYTTDGLDLSNGKLNVVIGINTGDYNNVQSVSSALTFEGEKTYSGSKKYKLYSVKEGIHNGKLFAYALSSNKYGVVLVTVGNDETKIPTSGELDAGLKIAFSAKATSYNSAQAAGFGEDKYGEIINSFNGEEATKAGDIYGDVYVDEYVNITLDEINE